METRCDGECSAEAVRDRGTASAHVLPAGRCDARRDVHDNALGAGQAIAAIRSGDRRPSRPVRARSGAHGDDQVARRKSRRVPTATFEEHTGSRSPIVFDGAWALFRLLDTAKLSQGIRGEIFTHRYQRWARSESSYRRAQRVEPVQATGVAEVPLLTAKEEAAVPTRRPGFS